MTPEAIANYKDEILNDKLSDNYKYSFIVGLLKAGELKIAYFPFNQRLHLIQKAPWSPGKWMYMCLMSSYIVTALSENEDIDQYKL
jgi:hypothetical protein